MNHKGIEHWKGIMAEYKSSGENQIDFCRNREISFPTFGYWRNKINKLKKSPEPVAIKHVDFVEHTIPASVASDGYSLEWPDGLRLRFPRTTSLDQVVSLLKSLRANPS